LAEGFSVDHLSGLTLDGLTKIEMRPIDIGGREKFAIWTRITEAGPEGDRAVIALPW
jgi:hypothetical protein